jgi:hypothetical protein
MKAKNLLFCLLILVASTTLLAANGSKGKRIVYEANIRMGDAESAGCHFLVELEPVLFQVESVQGKYRAIRINIRNFSQSPLKLSLDKDSIQVRVGARLVTGRLNLADSDQAWWDGLPADLRKALAYPDQAAIKGGEEENVFAYFPAADLSQPPTEIQFKVDGYSANPIVLSKKGVAAAKA